MGDLTLQQFLGAGATVTGFLLLHLWFNSRGELMWRRQIDREIVAIVQGYEGKTAALVKGYEEIIAMLKAQMQEERDDKNEWKAIVHSNFPLVKKAVEGVVEVAKKVGP